MKRAFIRDAYVHTNDHSSTFTFISIALFIFKCTIALLIALNHIYSMPFMHLHLFALIIRNLRIKIPCMKKLNEKHEVPLISMQFIYLISFYN